MRLPSKDRGATSFTGYSNFLTFATALIILKTLKPTTNPTPQLQRLPVHSSLSLGSYLRAEKSCALQLTVRAIIAAIIRNPKLAVLVDKSPRSSPLLVNEIPEACGYI